MGEASKDLRGFLQALEERDLLRRVNKPVDWRLEIGTIAHQLFQTRGPAALFENVKDADYPLLCGAIATTERYALGLGMPPDHRVMQQCVLEALQHPIAPVLVDRGHCQENVIEAGDIDLERFPTPVWHPHDGGRYIGTLGVIITQDPETGRVNTGIYREMIMDRDKHGILVGRDASIVLQKYQAMGKPMPVATCFGVDPATLTAAVAPFAYGDEELGLAGGLLGQPVALVKAKTLDIPVIANSEFVFEGTISPNREDWREEGPFGEYTGYYAGERRKQPTVQLTAITHRSNPIMQGTLEGRAPNESQMMQEMIRAATLKGLLTRMGVPGIKDAWRLARGFIAIVSLERHFYSGHAQQVMDAVMATQLYKWVIVVDGDVDVFNWEEVSWAMGTNVQPHTDITVTLNNRRGSTLDPSIPPEFRPRPMTRTSRVGIDATTQYKGYEWASRVKPDEEMLKQVLSQWDEYGFDDADTQPGIDPADLGGVGSSRLTGI